MSWTLILIAFITGLIVAKFVPKQRNNYNNQSQISENLIIDLLEMLKERQNIENVVKQSMTDLTVLEKLYFLGAATPIELAVHMNQDPKSVEQNLKNLQEKKYVIRKLINSGYEQEIYQISNIGKDLLDLEQAYQKDNKQFIKILLTMQKRIGSKAKSNLS